MILTRPGAVPSVAGSDTEIQFNSNGILAGDADLVWDKDKNVLTIAGNGDVPYRGIIRGVSDDIAGNGLRFEGGNGSGDDISGGIVEFSGGSSVNNAGGDVHGVAGNSINAQGGEVDFQGGDGATGGPIAFQAGSSMSGNNNGGFLAFETGDGCGSGSGGEMTFAGGSGGSTGKGGDIVFQLGAGNGGADDGQLRFFMPNGKYLNLDASLIASSDKTLTFPNASGTLALLETANIFTADQSVKHTGVSLLTVETSVDDSASGAQVRVKSPISEWGFYTGYGLASFFIYDVTNTKFPFGVEADAPDNSFRVNATTGNVGLGLPESASTKLHARGSLTLDYSYSAFDNGYYIRLIPQYGEEGMQLYYGTVKLLHTMEWTTPTKLYIDVGLSVAGNLDLTGYIVGPLTFAPSVAAKNDGYFVSVVPQYAEEGMKFLYNTTKLFHTMEYNAPAWLYVDVGLDVAGNSKFGAASTNTVTMTGRMLVRTTASDPQHITPGSRPAGTVGELAYYSGKLYLCTNAGTPAWEQLTSL